MTNWIFLNDDFVKEEEACLHHTDLSFQRGYGIFDFFRLVGHAPLFLQEHLNRFYASAETMHLPIAFSRQELETKILALITRNQLSNAGIRLGLTGGYAADSFTMQQPNLIISSRDIIVPGPEQVTQGIRLLSHPYQRQFSLVKTIDYLMATWLQPTLNTKGFDDVLYYHNGFITESSRSNIFIVTENNVLVTPKDDILKGITRMKLIDLAKQNYKVEERPVTLGEIKSAKEAFITSTIKSILPVRQLDDFIFTERKVGDELRQVFGDTYYGEVSTLTSQPSANCSTV